MDIQQIDHTYELKIDLGDFQTGTVEFYVLAQLDHVDIVAARQALQSMAAQNLRLAGAKVQNKQLPKKIVLGIDMPGLIVTKVGVGYGKKIKLGKGVGNRNIVHRIWAQILPGDDIETTIKELWQNVFDAYDEKIAALTAPKNTADIAETSVTPEQIKDKLIRLTNTYRGKNTTPSNRLRIPAMRSLEAATEAATTATGLHRSVTEWVLGYLFGTGTEPLVEYDLEAEHFSALLKWSKQDSFNAEVETLVNYLDTKHQLLTVTEEAFI